MRRVVLRGDDSGRGVDVRGDPPRRRIDGIGIGLEFRRLGRFAALLGLHRRCDVTIEIGRRHIELVAENPIAVLVFRPLLPRLEDDGNVELGEILGDLLLGIAVNPVLGIDRNDHHRRFVDPHRQPSGNSFLIIRFGRHKRHGLLFGRVVPPRNDPGQGVFVRSDLPKDRVGSMGKSLRLPLGKQLGDIARILLHKRLEHIVRPVRNLLETSREQHDGREQRY